MSVLDETAPLRIWLQIDSEAVIEDRDTAFPDETKPLRIWLKDGTQVEYVRETQYAALKAELDQEREWHEISKVNARRIAKQRDKLLDALYEMAKFAIPPIGGVSMQMKRDIINAANTAIEACNGGEA